MQKVPPVEVPWQQGEGGCSPDSPLLTRDPVWETNESPMKPWQQLFKLKLLEDPSCSGSRESSTVRCLWGGSRLGYLNAVCSRALLFGGCECCCTHLKVLGDLSNITSHLGPRPSSAPLFFLG